MKFVWSGDCGIAADRLCAAVRRMITIEYSIDECDEIQMALFLRRSVFFPVRRPVVEYVSTLCVCEPSL